MALETGTNISDLNASNPATGDAASDGDNHIRLVKTVLKTDFPNFVSSTTGVVATQAELSQLGAVVAGTVAASKAVVVSAASKVDVWNVDNITIDGNTITTSNTNGDLLISANGTGDVDFDACSILIDTGESIKDAGGDPYITFTESTTPSNYFGVATSDTGSGPILSAIGGDANIDLNVTPKGTGGVVVNGKLVIAETSTISGAGAIPVTASLCEITTTGADAMTLANGVERQELTLLFVSDGGDATITPSNFANGTTLTFADVNDSADLVFTNGSWYMKGIGYGSPVVA